MIHPNVTAGLVAFLVSVVTAGAAPAPLAAPRGARGGTQASRDHLRIVDLENRVLRLEQRERCITTSIAWSEPGHAGTPLVRWANRCARRTG